ncbi:MAG: hypothetical protein ACJZ42_00345 [Candidatus Thalassarchaeaceae archaeon]
MEAALRDLLRIKSVNLRPHNEGLAPHGFTCLGVATSIPELEIHSNEVFIWHARAGILPITKSEIIRFGMDAPSGLNLILSERPIQSECYSVDTFDFRILEPEDVSLWVGKAVLSGDLIATAKDADDRARMEQYGHESPIEKMLVMKPTIEVNSWCVQRGMAGVSSTPVLISARLWTVLGELQGPNGENESGEWTILEDPWSKTVTLLNDIQSLQNAPILRTIEPQDVNWLNPDRINEELAKVIEERRRGNSGKSSVSGTVRSMLLQKWPLDSEGAIVSHSKIMIPGWVIHLETEKILHGRNGRLYDS